MDQPVPETPLVYVPDFKGPALAMARLSGDYTVCKKLFLEADWVTQDLRRHIETLFPSCDAINSGTRVRDKVAFMDACSVLFEKGRISPPPCNSSRLRHYFLTSGVSSVPNMGRRLYVFTMPRW
jgi:hypothetical protein